VLWHDAKVGTGGESAFYGSSDILVYLFKQKNYAESGYDLNNLGFQLKAH